MEVLELRQEVVAELYQVHLFVLSLLQQAESPSLTTKLSFFR